MRADLSTFGACSVFPFVPGNSTAWADAAVVDVVSEQTFQVSTKRILDIRFENVLVFLQCLKHEKDKKNKSNNPYPTHA